MIEYEFIVIRGTKKGTRYSLNDEKTSIGRSIDNAIVLEDDMVSRHHCFVVRKGEDLFEIQDLASTNRTVINGSFISDKRLSIGDHIQIGETVFLFTTVKDEELMLEKAKTSTGTKVINVTEIKMLPDENKLLDVSQMGNDFDELRRAHRDLATVYRLGSLINSIQDTNELLGVLADKLIDVLQPSRVVLMLFGDGRGKIVNKVIRVFGPGNKDASDISMSMVHEAVRDGVSILSYDALADERFRDKQSVILNRIRSAMCTPIKVRENVLGILYVDTNISAGKFSEQDLQLLSIIGNQAGIAIQNAKLYEDLDDLFTGSLKTLVATLEAKDSVTSGHSIRVTKICGIIAKELGLGKESMRILNISALLHDIGKIGVPESILGKPAPLNENEFIRMREHSVRGAEIIKNIKNVEEVVTAVRHHHERYDGGGIPDGLKGDAIPLVSRIIAIADTFDAMTYDRPYRKGVAIDKAVKEIQRCSGAQFDPKLVDVFMKAYEKGLINENLAE
jgi:putative nucleotidyltransferase with HDIG domain